MNLSNITKTLLKPFGGIVANGESKSFWSSLIFIGLIYQLLYNPPANGVPTFVWAILLLGWLGTIAGNKAKDVFLATLSSAAPQLIDMAVGSLAPQGESVDPEINPPNPSATG